MKRPSCFLPLWETLKKRGQQKKGALILNGTQAPLHICIGGWRKLNAEFVSFFIVSLLLKAFLICACILSTLDYWILLICLATVQNLRKDTKAAVDLFGELWTLFYQEGKWLSWIKGLPGGDLRVGENYGEG